MRKLVTLRKVTSIQPIPNADMIELAHIDGWQCVIKKSELKPGDWGIYFEIDSFLPIDPKYEFLRKSCLRKMVGKEGFRIKTIKLRGVLSQGLLMPLSSFPELKIDNADPNLDLSELLKVEKWDPPLPACLAGQAKGNFPSFVSKTDELRVQNLPEYFDQYKDQIFEETIKLDGTSATIYWNNGTFGVCSRNLELTETPDNILWKMARFYDMEQLLTKFGRNVALQGEVIGEGIQNNNEQIKGQEFRLFNIFDIDQYGYVDPATRLDILDQINRNATNPIPHVPILGYPKIFQLYPTMDQLLERANGTSLNPQRKREGLVYKTKLIGARSIISFKVISNAYLLDEK